MATLLNDPKNRIELNDNGAWSWFMDERVIVHNGKLVVGSVRSSDRSYVWKENGEFGAVEVAVHDIANAQTQVVVLHAPFEQDDHNGPSLHVRPDGRVVAIYSRHAMERKVFWRVSASDDLLSWNPEQVLITPGKDAEFGGDNATYSNPWQPAAEGGRLYNFFRCVGHQQNWMHSDDNGDTWHYGGMFLKGSKGYAPYFKYAPAGIDRFWFIGTENHPRDFDNSVYAGFIRNGHIYRSDGSLYAPLSKNTEKSGDIWDLTCVYRGDADHVAWVIDLHIDPQGNPVCLFSTQRDGKGLPRNQGGLDHRYHYARWDGQRWVEHEIAYAGTRLYVGEDDYTGLAALDPLDLSSVYISTDAHPVTGEALVSKADDKRHWELFHGRTLDGGATWVWTPLTQDSTADNLRPIIPIWNDPRVALVWMCGDYPTHRGPWTTKVMAAMLPRGK
ncbi:MAG: BNR-4 repeat-containing protein [Tepidisphaeraceae bacterium]